MNKLFLEEMRKLKRWQGQPDINKVKQYETLLSFKVSVFIQFILSVKHTEFVYLLFFSAIRNQSTKIFLFFPKTA